MVAVLRSSPSTVRCPGCWPGGTRGSSLKAVTGIISTPGVYTCELGEPLINQSTIYNQSTYPVSTLRRKSMTVLLGTVLPGNIPSRTRHSCITPSLSRDPGARNIVAAR